jgi:hypothetical protein
VLAAQLPPGAPGVPLLSTPGADACMRLAAGLAGWARARRADAHAACKRGVIEVAALSAHERITALAAAAAAAAGPPEPEPTPEREPNAEVLEAHLLRTPSTPLPSMSRLAAPAAPSTLRKRTSTAATAKYVPPQTPHALRLRARSPLPFPPRPGALLTRYARGLVHPHASRGLVRVLLGALLLGLAYVCMYKNESMLLCLLESE